MRPVASHPPLGGGQRRAGTSSRSPGATEPPLGGPSSPRNLCSGAGTERGKRRMGLADAAAVLHASGLGYPGRAHPAGSRSGRPRAASDPSHGGGIVPALTLLADRGAVGVCHRSPHREDYRGSRNGLGSPGASLLELPRRVAPAGAFSEAA